MQTTKTTSEIKKLLTDANIEYDWAVNTALNAYLPKLLPTCPFTEQICNNKQCNGCESSNKK